ncbi:MAG: hypothetical protein ACR2LE_10350 [Nocardioidaceae bacterium]
MSDGIHPAADELADLQVGLVDAPTRSRLTAHLSTCVDCTATVAALDDVARLLAAEGGQPLVMPPTLAHSLDDRLRRLGVERQAGVPSLAERRVGSGAKTTAARSGRWTRQAVFVAAAAVVGVTGVWGIAHLDGGSSSQSDSASSAPADEAAEGLSGSTSGGSGNNSSPHVPGTAVMPRHSAEHHSPEVVGPRTLAAFAAGLAKTGRASNSVPADSVPGGTCPVRDHLLDVGRHSDQRVTATPVRWQGDLAVVLVRPAGRQATVVSCEPPARRLYSTTY